MYHEYYQFKENPFNTTADPDFFFASKMHADAVANLMYGIEQRKGILVVTGEIGTGKTTLCRKLFRLSSEQIKFALIFNPKCSDVQLLQMITHDLGLKTKSKSKFSLLQALNDYLISESIKGNNVVVVIDESQLLTTKQLEQVRLLSNLETEKDKLLQIVLVGQPELYDKLQLPELRQLRQRVAVHFHVQPLNQEDVKHYIDHRLNMACLYPNHSARLQFTEAAIDSIFHYSKGSPRTINILCDRALLAGYVAETFSINEDIIQNCAKEIMYCEHY